MPTTTISGILNIGTGTPPDSILSDIAGTNTSFNLNREDIDFAVYGTGGNSLIYFDASTGRLGIGTGLPQTALHVVAPCSTDGMKIESITNCATGVRLTLRHSPGIDPVAGSYPATINLMGRDESNRDIIYGQITSKILNATNGNTSGELIFTVDKQQTNKTVFSATPLNVYMGPDNTVNGNNFSVVGNNNNLSGVSYVLIGSSNSGVLNSGIVLGLNSVVRGSQIFGILSNSIITGVNDLLIGNSGILYGTGNISIGNSTNISGNYNAIVGNNISGVPNLSVALSQFSVVSGVSGIYIGSYLTNSGNSNIYLGNLNRIVGSNDTLVGSFSLISGTNDIVFGNSDNIVGSDIISLGSNQTLTNINSGLFIGNNILLSNTDNLIVMGLQNNIGSGLGTSVLLGSKNDLSSGTSQKIILVGQSNLIQNSTGCLVFGNDNNLSGNLTNNIVVGSTNAVPLTSNNNIILGALNNQTGVYINSSGLVTGTAQSNNSSINNSIVAGINNNMRFGDSNVALGHKNSVSGYNVGVVGSYNTVSFANKSQVMGNSNFVVGSNIKSIGDKVSAIGSNSFVVNTDDVTTNIFGSGNIIIGSNGIVNNGLVVGSNNNLKGSDNIIYGKNNNLGLALHAFTSTNDNFLVINGDVTSTYAEGDIILINIQNPAYSTSSLTRTITSAVVSSPGGNAITTLGISSLLTAQYTNQGYYVTNSSFNDNNAISTTNSGYITLYYKASLGVYCGSSNIILGSSNRTSYSDCVVVGNNNNVSGVNNIVIGSNLSGISDNTVYIGTNNINKIITTNNGVVFNSGGFQDFWMLKPSLDNRRSLIYASLTNQYVGINTDTPSAELSVSGNISTSGIQIRNSATDGYILTSDSVGNATWQIPGAKITGSDLGLMIKSSNLLTSGLSNVLYNPAGNFIRFNLDNKDGLLITSTGLLLNNGFNGSEEGRYGLNIKGTAKIGGTENLLATNFDADSIDFYNISGNSGTLSELKVTDGVTLPTSLVGTLLKVNSNGALSSYTTTAPNVVLFSNGSSVASGSTSFRWIDSQKSLALGATGEVPTNDELIENDAANNITYNIILSSKNTIDTVINNKGLSNSFSIMNSGADGSNYRYGCHYDTFNKTLIVNERIGAFRDPGDIPVAESSGVNLWVNGKAWVDKLRIGAADSTTPGYYLKAIDSSGNTEFAPLAIDASFSGFSTSAGASANPLNRYPINVSTANSITRIGFTNTSLSGGSLDHGQTLVWDGEKWKDSDFIKIYQTDDNSVCRGIEFGANARIRNTSGTHNHVFAGGTFKSTDPTNFEGSSQYSMRYLRGRTMTAGSLELTTDFDTDFSPAVSRNNTIDLSYNIGNVSLYRVWSFNIEASLLYQGNDPPYPTSGAVFFIQGGVAVTEVYPYTPVLLGNNIITSRGNVANGIGISVFPTGGPDDWRLTVHVTGITNTSCLWSATARLNELTIPSNIRFIDI